MNLYRKLVLDPLDDTEIEAGWFLCGNDGRFDIWFVPVERCKHGNYARHIIDNDECIYDRAHQWCLGAGIGEDSTP